MTIYLTIITTVLVITQIIRLIQNTISLKRYKNVIITNEEILEENARVRKDNTYVMEIHKKLEQALDIYLDKEV